jgi:acyl dehydratase
VTAPVGSATEASPLALDFDALEPGQRFTTRGRTITESDVVSFAALTGDLHPQHVDADWAAASRFGERVAHGMLVLSYAVGLLPLDPDRVLALRRVREAVFKRPARLGDTVHVEGRIDAVKPLDATTGVVATGWRVRRQDGATVARVEVDVLWRRGSPPEHATTEAGAATSEPRDEQAVVLPL